MKTFLNDITLGEFITFLCGNVHTNNADTKKKLSYICTDSREMCDGAVFVAIAGERTDGHKYIDTAINGGASLIMCEHLPESLTDGCAYAVYENSEKALQHAAHEYRMRYCNGLRSVAVTGSVGKTTAKEMIYSALSSALTVYKTDGNFNSVIGMPISLLGMNREYDHAVFEMGMSSLGEIHAMSTTLEPYIGVITNVGHSHLEYLKTRENILRAKLEVADGIKNGGYLVINGDDEMLSSSDLSKDGLHVIRCSLKNRNADYFATNIKYADDGFMTFDLEHDGNVITKAKVPGVGEHLVLTALFALACGDILGVPSEKSLVGIENYKNASMRQSIEKIGGITVIEDCYNAAPESMNAALDTLSRIRSQGDGRRSLAVLGDMKELGEDSEDLHRSVGRKAAKSGVDFLLTFGELARFIEEGAIECGMNEKSVVHVDDLADMEYVGGILREHYSEGDVMLVKASRSMRAERAVEYLREVEKKNIN